ncbi:MAG: amino acid permease [Pirellulales bacterium]
MIEASVCFSALVMMVTASMIGVGNTQAAVMRWLLSAIQARKQQQVVTGVWAIAGAVAYGAIASRVTISGGEYVYLSRLMHPSVGFLAGWISLISGFTVPIASSAKLVARYGTPDGTGDVTLNGIASIVILAAAALHAMKLHVGVASQNLVVVLKLITFGILFTWAFGFAPSDAWHGGPLPEKSTAVLPESAAAWMTFAASLIWISLSYTGFNAAIYVAGESKTAEQNVPRSMLLATLVVMVIYLISNVIFLYAPDSREATADVKSMEGIAALATRALGGSDYGKCPTSSHTVVRAQQRIFVAAGRAAVYSQMALDGVMPKVFLASGGVYRDQPILLQASLSILVVWIWPDLQTLIEYLNMTLAMCSSLAIASIWFIPFTVPAEKIGTEIQHNSVRWYEHTAAVIYILGTLIMAWLRSTAFESSCTSRRAFIVGLFFYVVWIALKP